MIELLVVIAIIGILASFLLPVLSKTRKKARGSVCVSNQKQIGTAYLLYADDNNSEYPYHSHRASLLGDRGVTPHAGMGGNIAPESRPLNQYLNNAYKTAFCPNDMGIAGTGWESVYSRTGNSYNPAVYHSDPTGSLYAVDYVTIKSHAQTPKILSDWTDPSIKIVQGDWVWHPNRAISEPKHQWHSSGARKFNMLFADGHVALFTFPPFLRGDSGLNNSRSESWILLKPKE